MNVPDHWKNIGTHGMSHQLERMHEAGKRFQIFFSAVGDEQIVFDRESQKLIMIWDPKRYATFIDPSFML